MGVLQAQFLAHQREDGLVEHLILEVQGHRGLLALRQILDVMATANGNGMLKELTLHGTARLYLLLHTHVDLLPEPGHRRHTRGVLLLHGLLHLQRIGVDNESCASCQAQYLPALLEDVSERQEVQYAVVLVDGHALTVGHHCCVILATGQDDTLGIARRATGVEDIGYVIHLSLSRQVVDLRLSWQSLTQLQEVVEVHGQRVFITQFDPAVEHDDALQGVAGGLHTMGLVVLLLLTHEEDADFRVSQHELYLLLRAGGIERNSHRTDAPCTEVAK